MLHRYVDNFKPGAHLNGQKLECIASTPNYPNDKVMGHILLNVERRSSIYTEW